MKRMVIFWQSATILLSTFFALCSIEVLANGGIGYKGIKLNVAGTQTWYKAHNVRGAITVAETINLILPQIFQPHHWAVLQDRRFYG